LGGYNREIKFKKKLLQKEGFKNIF